MRSLLAITTILTLAALTMLGCGGEANGAGTLNIFMSDAPAPGVESVDIKIDRVEAHLNGTWTEVGGELPMINLLDLRDESMLIASSGLPSGTYTQIRFFVSEASITDADGTHEIIIPSNLNTGIKVNIGATVEEGSVTTVLLDFNVHKSVVQQGNGTYRLQPVIPAVIVNLAGTVTGTVTLNALPVEGAVVTATYTEGDSYPIGTEVNTSVSAADGTFKIWALLEGKYTISVTYETAIPESYEVSLADVVVTRQSDNNVGDLELVLVP